MTTPPSAAPPLPPQSELDEIEARLSATRENIWAMLRAPIGTYLMVVGHNELAALNADLGVVRALNAAIHPHYQSRRVAAWPDPVLPMHVLLAPRNLLPALGDALHTFAVHHQRVKTEANYVAR